MYSRYRRHGPALKVWHPSSNAHLRSDVCQDDMALSPARIHEVEALYEARKGKDTFVDYEIKVYKGMYLLLFESRRWADKLFCQVPVSFASLVTWIHLKIIWLAHGFGARPNFKYPDVKAGFEQAFQQAVDWYNKTIPA
jgi:carboxymethylenebutenolidase